MTNRAALQAAVTIRKQFRSLLTSGNISGCLNLVQMGTRYADNGTSKLLDVLLNTILEPELEDAAVDGMGNLTTTLEAVMMTHLHSVLVRE